MLVQGVTLRTDGPFAIHILARPPDKRKRDLDNLLKPILDALVDYCAIPDDSMIDDLRIQRMNPVADGQIEVQIR
jgi:crossover junction endodeoxyribonuclease RusA